MFFICEIRYLCKVILDFNVCQYYFNYNSKIIFVLDKNIIKIKQTYLLSFWILNSNRLSTYGYIKIESLMFHLSLFNGFVIHYLIIYHNF